MRLSKIGLYAPEDSNYISNILNLFQLLWSVFLINPNLEHVHFFEVWHLRKSSATNYIMMPVDFRDVVGRLIFINLIK